MDNVTLAVHEASTGAYGELNRAQLIDTVSDRLVDWVYEYLLEHGISFHRLRQNDVCILDDKDPDNPDVCMRVYRAIQDLVAIAMVAQHESDEKINGELIAAEELRRRHAAWP
jgi:hypothetical protein